ncbi:MAG: MFS transporter, partial [Planctomycetota bacterium]
MKQEHYKSLRQAFAGVWPLYGAASAMAMSLSVLWTAMPFIMKNIGGTEGHVGIIWAANMSGYLFCLLVAASALGHLNPRHTTRASAAVMLAATVVTAAAVYLAVAQKEFGNAVHIWTMIGAATLAGGAMSLFWPFLMSWVSADYEGAALNRRLGAYNGMWSSAAIMGPAIGGALGDLDTRWPVAVALGCLGFCLILLCYARDGSAVTAASKERLNEPKTSFDPRLLGSFRWTARITL